MDSEKKDNSMGNNDSTKMYKTKAGDDSKSNNKQTTRDNKIENNTGDDVDNDDNQDEENDSVNVCGTFLDALVTFAIKFTSNDMTNITHTHHSDVNNEE